MKTRTYFAQAGNLDAGYEGGYAMNVENWGEWLNSVIIEHNLVDKTIEYAKKYISICKIESPDSYKDRMEIAEIVTENIEEIFQIHISNKGYQINSYVKGETEVFLLA